MVVNPSLEAQIAELLGEPMTSAPSNLNTPEMRARACKWVASGKTLKSFCSQPGTPSTWTVFQWMRDDPAGFGQEMSLARECGFDVLMQQCLTIADSGDESNVKHRTLQVTTRMKVINRWDQRAPLRLLVGGDPDNATPIQVKSLTDAEIMREVMQLLATAKKRQIADVENRVGRLLN